MSNDKARFTTEQLKFLSVFVERMVPDYVRDDHPQFIEFLKAFFEFLERDMDTSGELGEYKQIADLVQNMDVDHALEVFIPQYEKQYLASIPHKALDSAVETTDKSFLAKSIRKEYKNKGTKSSIDFLFRREFDKSAEVFYPGESILKVSNSKWVEPKWITVGGEKLFDANIESAFIENPDLIHPTTVTLSSSLLTTPTAVSYSEDADGNANQDWLDYVSQYNGAQCFAQNVFHSNTVDSSITQLECEAFIGGEWRPYGPKWDLLQNSLLTTVAIDDTIIPYYEYTDDPSLDPDGPYDGIIWSVVGDTLTFHNGSTIRETYKVFNFHEIIPADGSVEQTFRDFIVYENDFAILPAANQNGTEFYIIYDQRDPITGLWPLNEFGMFELGLVGEGSSAQYVLDADGDPIPMLWNGNINTPPSIVLPAAFGGATDENRVSFRFTDIYEDSVVHIRADATHVSAEQNIYKVYDKQLIAQTSGSCSAPNEDDPSTPLTKEQCIASSKGTWTPVTCFVDYSDEQRLAEYDKLALSEITGELIQGEEVWENVGTTGKTPVKLTITSDGIVSPGKCYINGNEDNTLLTQDECANCQIVDPVKYKDIKTNVWLTDGYWADSSSFLSSDKKMEDNDYYQDFSYVVRSEVPLEAYRQVIKQLVHPVGLKLFAQYSLTSNMEMGARLPEKFADYLIRIFSYLDVAVDVWKPGYSYGNFHGKNFVWDRPEEFTLLVDDNAVVVPDVYTFSGGMIAQCYIAGPDTWVYSPDFDGSDAEMETWCNASNEWTSPVAGYCVDYLPDLYTEHLPLGQTECDYEIAPGLSAGTWIPAVAGFCTNHTDWSTTIDNQTDCELEFNGLWQAEQLPLPVTIETIDKLIGDIVSPNDVLFTLRSQYDNSLMNVTAASYDSWDHKGTVDTISYAVGESVNLVSSPTEMMSIKSTGDITIPEGSFSHDYATETVNGQIVVTAGQQYDEETYIMQESCTDGITLTERLNYDTQTACETVSNFTGFPHGVWGTTIISTTLGMHPDTGKQLTRTMHNGTAKDAWFFMNPKYKDPSLYARSGQFALLGDQASAEDYRDHQGFEVFVDGDVQVGYDDYVLEILKGLEVRSELVPAHTWGLPTDHYAVNIIKEEPFKIGNFIKEKLYTVSTMNDEVRLFMNAFPEEATLEFTKHLRVLDYDSLPPAATSLEIYDNIDNATYGGMISCEIWELAVMKGLESVLKWMESFVGIEEYAKEQTYHHWDVNRESSRVQHTYGLGCDVLDSVKIGAFLTDDGQRSHSHGGAGGFAPLVETTLTKGFELPQMDINVSTFHTHEFNGEAIPNLLRQGEEVTARGMNFTEGRALMNREAFVIPEFMGANLVCGGIMTPNLWGDWIDSNTDARYNGVGECMDPTYPDEATCEAALGAGRWMPAMCTNQTSTDEASCNADGHSWGYYTMSTLDPMKGHSSFFVENLVVDAQRGRTADPLTRDQARFLIDNPTEHVVLYDNIAALDQDGDIQDSAIINGVTQGGTIQNVNGGITSAHYHQYHVRYDHNWETYINENKLEHGFIFEAITTWICFNYQPDLPIDETIMGGQDFFGNQWPQNVFLEVPDSMVATLTGNPAITLQHNQVWEETHDSKVDWVEIFSSNFIQQVPGSGDTGDLIGVEVIGTGTDIATIEAYPIPSYLTSSERNMWIHVQHTVMDHMNGIVTAHTDLWAYLQEIMPDGFARIDFIKDGVINQLDLDAYTDEIYKERIIDDAHAVPALVTNFFLDATPQYPIAIVDQSGYIHLQNTTDGSIKDLLLDLSSLQHVIGLGSFNANYDERGTLGLAFHPDYENNGKFYVYYMTELDPSELGSFATGAYGFPKSRTHISEFTADLSGARPIADVSTERELLRVDQPDFNHNGGEVAFGPDGYLYIGLGDGGSADDTSWQGTHGEYGNAQNPTNLLGSILRIDVTPDPIAGTEYTIPADNPFVNSIYKEGTAEAEAWRGEAFAYGFRNPWRFSWAPNGDFWVADVGQNKFEEINIVEKGGNYGWRIIEGYHAFEENQSLIDQAAVDLGYANTVEFMNDLKEPIHEYTHGTGISILGGFVYRGAIPELIGKYIFGDWSTDWSGTSGHLYTLEENSSGLSATFNVLANPTNGANHGHTCSLTAAQVELMKANPGTVVNVPQTDTTHASFYTHIFSIIWSSAGAGSFVLIGQTNTEGHDQLNFIEYSDAVGYIRKPLSIWDPATQTVDLTTLGMSILTMGEDTDGEIYISTRVGINTFQEQGGAGPQNCTIAKITASYDSSVLGQTVIDQIPASEMAHVHAYKIEWDDDALAFIGEEIADIEMTVWDAFFPEWIQNTPASHVHPLTIQWSNAVDSFIPVGSSAGWDGSAPYDIGADTAWAPPAQASDDYVSIGASPTIIILPSNEFAKESHQHYFSGVLLDTYGINYGRTSDVISRYDAEVLANAPQGTIHKLYGSIHEYPDGNRHYHEIEITYNTATKQFYGIEVSEWVEPTQGTGEYFLAESQTHEHGITVDGIVTAIGWSGNPIFEAPIIATYYAHDWDNLNGSEASHNHIFDGSGLDSVGPNVDRKANALSNEETTNLMDGSLEEVILYSRVVGDHYHSYRLTYDGPTNSILAEEIGLWLTDGSGQYFLQSTATHQHAVSVAGVITGTGYSETIDSTDLPITASPGFPFPGGSHPHFHINTVVGPFPDGHIDYAHGLSVDEAQRLIDGIVTSVVIYDSIEGAHFHEYTIKWNDTSNTFYVSSSSTWIRGGIEDQTQESNKYYPATIMNESEGLHWHNLTIEWNPNDTQYPQQSGGSVYTTRVTSMDEVVYADPVTTTSSQSTELNPVSTTYPDTPGAGDTTVITVYEDLVTTTVDISIQVTTTTTTTTYKSDDTQYDTVQIPIITTNETSSSSSNTIEDMDERTTVVNSILQANNPPNIFFDPTFIDGEGTHDHVQFDGCTLDTQGTYAGRMCEEITLETANFLINAQDANIASVFYDSPNGALSHYHSYKLKYNPFQGPDGAFIVNSFSQYNQVAGTGTSIHKFTLTGGFHQHDYWCTDAEYLSLVTGSQIIMVQRDSIHADSYQHTLTISYTGTYNIISQTSDFDGHNLLVYNGVQVTGGEWNEVSVTPGDHIHGTVIDESNVWPVSPS